MSKTKRNKLRKSRITKASIAAALTLMSVAMSANVAFAADIGPGTDHTTYTGPGTTTMFKLDGETEASAYKTPTASDRCSLKYYGVDKYKVNAADVKVMAYHVIEGNYNQDGFLGWTQTAASATITKFKSFQKTTDNVVQVVVSDTDPESANYNNGLVITSDNISNIAKALWQSDANEKFTDKVELTWNEDENCYMTKEAKAGTYIVLVEKEDRGVIYNPVIISNDYANANIARSLSNYIDKDGNNASIHDDKIFEDNFGEDKYKTGVNESNTAFVGYGSVNPDDVKNSLVTGDNKDKAPQAQTDYMNSHETVIYYKDTQKAGSVYSLYHDTEDQAAGKNLNEKRIETLALKGVAYAKKSSTMIEKNIVNASVPKTYATAGTTSTRDDGTQYGYSKYDDVSEGDTVQYDIVTQVPYYSTGYFNGEDDFVFKITDTQHAGLKAVDASNIKVYAADSTGTDAQSIAADVIGNTMARGDYEIKTDADKNEFSISFRRGWVLTNPGKMIVVRYTTTVTSDAAKGLNGNPNEVFLEYTTAPTTPDKSPSRGYKFDFAIQYTFSPTAFKIGENGTISTVEGQNTLSLEDQADIAKGESVDKPLAGAKFKLQRVGTHYNGNEVGNYDIPADTTKWKNTKEKEKDPKTSYNGYQTWFLTSDENGMIKFDSAMDGIDEGIYTIQEVEAPENYTINDKIYVIDVSPKFDTNAQRFIGTDIKIGAANLNANGSIKSYNTTGATFVDGTNYDYDQYGKLLSEYTYSEWVSNQLDNYDGSVANLTAARSSQDSTVKPNVEGSTREIHTTTVKYLANENGSPSDEKIAKTDLIGIINTKLTRLPSTGGIGTILYTVAGFALMGVAAVVIGKKKTKKDSTDSVE